MNNGVTYGAFPSFRISVLLAELTLMFAGELLLAVRIRALAIILLMFEVKTFGSCCNNPLTSSGKHSIKANLTKQYKPSAVNQLSSPKGFFSAGV